MNEKLKQLAADLTEAAADLKRDADNESLSDSRLRATMRGWSDELRLIVEELDPAPWRRST